MPKLKTHSGAKKRFKLTKKGIVRHKKAYARHLLTKKSSKRARGLKRPGVVGKSKRGMLRRALPYE